MIALDEKSEDQQSYKNILVDDDLCLQGEYIKSLVSTYDLKYCTARVRTFRSS